MTFESGGGGGGGGGSDTTGNGGDVGGESLESSEVSNNDGGNGAGDETAGSEGPNESDLDGGQELNPDSQEPDDDVKSDEPAPNGEVDSTDPMDDGDDSTDSTDDEADGAESTDDNADSLESDDEREVSDQDGRADAGEGYGGGNAPNWEDPDGDPEETASPESDLVELTNPEGLPEYKRPPDDQSEPLQEQWDDSWKLVDELVRPFLLFNQNPGDVIGGWGLVGNLLDTGKESTDTLSAAMKWDPSKGTPVLGRESSQELQDARNGELPGHTALNFKNDGTPDGTWTTFTNREYIQSIIDQKGTVLLGSDVIGSNLWNQKRGEPSVYALELQQLFRAGYTKKGRYLYPPTESLA